MTFKELIDHCHYSKKGAAKVFGVHYETIRNWYYGKTATPEEVIAKMKELKQAHDKIFEG